MYNMFLDAIWVFKAVPAISSLSYNLLAVVQTLSRTYYYSVKLK